jgi:hypothetical protein
MGPGVRMVCHRRSLACRSYEDDGRTVMIGRSSDVIAGTLVRSYVTLQRTFRPGTFRS